MPLLRPLLALVVLTGASALALGSGAPARAATAIDLGTAASFAVLAGSGITNTGATTIDGDMGTSPNPSETGVAPCPSAANCVTLTGSNHPADATALQAKLDLASAYDEAAGLPSDAALTPELGGQTLTAGVYRATSSLGLTGEVVLDAQGSADAVFVFQVGTTLITASASTITLVNGASACNVFFQVGTAVTLGASSTFRGTLLVHDDISVGDAVTVEGRLLGGEQASGLGAVTLIHDTIAVPDCTPGTGPSGGPSTDPTAEPTAAPTGEPTGQPSGGPGAEPSTGSGGASGSAPANGTSGGGAGGSSGGSASGLAAGGSTGGSAADSLPVTGTTTRAVAALGLLGVLMGAGLLVAGREVRLAGPERPARHR